MLFYLLQDSDKSQGIVSRVNVFAIHFFVA